MHTLMDKFMEVERAHYPKAGYRFKSDVLLHKVIAFYMRPFNHRYLDGFTTTVYPNTDFPETYRGQDARMLQTEVHENMHKWRRHTDGFSWSMKYAYPQIFALPFILATAILAGAFGWIGLGALVLLFHAGLLACHLGRGERGEPSGASKALFYTLSAIGGLALIGGGVLGGGWFALLYLGAGLFLSPWPLKSFWRRDEELLGYTTSLYWWLLRDGEIRTDLVDHYVGQFTGGNYFWMETNEKRIREEFVFQMQRMQGDEESFLRYWAWRNKRGWTSPEMAEPFRMMKRFMEKEGLVHVSRQA